MAETNGNEPHRNEPTLLNIEDDMRQSYLDYAMSVNIGRALPQIRDGLKPVHRRILYAMFREGLLANRRYSKCAGVVGEVLKRYHPHGDIVGLRRARAHGAAVQPALSADRRPGKFRLGRSATRPPPIDTLNASLTRLAERMLADIDKDTVDFRADLRRGSEQEPVVMPGGVPEPAGQRLRRVSRSAWRPTFRRTTRARSAMRCCT